MNIHFILHETFEVPGAYLKWAQDRGHNITSTKVYEEEILPETVVGIDFLIVMGGPQSPMRIVRPFLIMIQRLRLHSCKKQLLLISILLGFA